MSPFQGQDQGQGQDQKWRQRSAQQQQMVLALTLELVQDSASQPHLSWTTMFWTTMFGLPRYSKYLVIAIGGLENMQKNMEFYEKYRGSGPDKNAAPRP